MNNQMNGTGWPAAARVGGGPAAAVLPAAKGRGNSRKRPFFSEVRFLLILCLNQLALNLFAPNGSEGFLGFPGKFPGVVWGGQSDEFGVGRAEFPGKEEL
jgi:hypothetical protein